MQKKKKYATITTKNNKKIKNKNKVNFEDKISCRNQLSLKTITTWQQF